MDIQKEREAWEKFTKTKFNNFGLVFSDFKSTSEYIQFITWLAAKEQAIKAKKVAVPNIGLKVEITNPDDTAEDGVKIGDQGVVVWIDSKHKTYGVNFQKSGETFAYALSDFKVVDACGVPDWFVLVPSDTIRAIHSTCDLALESEAVYRSALIDVRDALSEFAEKIEAQEQEG